MTRPSQVAPPIRKVVVVAKVGPPEGLSISEHAQPRERPPGLRTSRPRYELI